MNIYKQTNDLISYFTDLDFYLKLLYDQNYHVMHSLTLLTLATVKGKNKNEMIAIFTFLQCVFYPV